VPPPSLFSATVTRRRQPAAVPPGPPSPPSGTSPPPGTTAPAPSAADTRLAPPPLALEDLLPLTPPKLRRRPWLIALGLLLIVISAIVSWYVVTMVKDTVQVVAALKSIPRGSVIERSDLTTAEIRPDPLLRTIPAAELDRLVGQQAAADISAGVLVAPEAVTAQLPPAVGQAVVGVALGVDQMPATRPRHGQPVTLVTTPGQGDTAGGQADSAATPPEVAATVLDYSDDEVSGVLVIDVLVPKEQAATVASLAAQNRLAAYWDAE